MTSLRPVSFYGLKVPSNGLRIDANPGMPASFQITMAAIDPTEEVTSSGDVPPRAVLKIVRNIFDVVDDESEDDDDEDYDDDDIEAIRRRLGITGDGADDSDSDEEMEDDSDEEMVNGGPSDPEKARKAMAKSIAKQLEEEGDDEDLEVLTNGINGSINKGKGRASDDDISEDGLSEYVVCTLDPTKNLQQPLNIFINLEEECYFRVIGNYNVHLTGNFVIPNSDIADSEDDEDDEEEDEEEAAARLQDLIDGIDEDEDDLEIDDIDSEDDDLDDLDDPRITEVDSDEEAAPALVKTETSKKNKNKRAADDDADDVVKKLEKEDDKRSNKKIKTNGGQAAAPEKKPEVKDNKKNNKDAKKTEEPQTNGKKVQFAEKLEQGPTPSKSPPTGKRNVNGVSVDDKKIGDGPGAKKGDKVALRYIGKLKDGKMFDSNKKGKPFDFKLGSGEVIKGWDIGVVGMKVGGERRIIIPAKLAYGNKKLPGIPANSDLTFDIKVISIN